MIETSRFIAKIPTLAHLDDWYNLLMDAEVMHYIRKKPASREEVLSMYLEPSMSHFEKHGFTSCSIFDKETHAFAGCAGIFHLAYDDSQPDIELGCFLHKAYWKKGCAQELARGFFDWGFANLRLEKIVAVANPLNENSWGVMRKLGMKYICNEMYDNKYEVVRYEIYA